MIVTNNIPSVLLAILPVFLYSYLVFHLIPYRYLSKRRLRMYLVNGTIAPALVLLFNYAFPEWGDFMFVPTVFSLLFQAFIQISLLEELTKFTAFQWVSSQRRNSEYDLPIATMYYCLMTSAAFAIVENIRYLISFGDGVLFLRGVTAILTHMICGVIMGYFIAKSRSFGKIVLIEKINKKISLFDESPELKVRIKKVKYVIYGVLYASFFHGLYDLNLLLPFNLYREFTTFLIIMFGLIIGYYMITELIEDSKALRNKNYYKDLESNKYH